MISIVDDFQDVIKAFTIEFEDASQIIRTKLDLFDIRRSVLDFVEPISNFSIQLRKHFRSYPEMIKFSSKYFYGDSLQVMKIRGKANRGRRRALGLRD